MVAMVDIISNEFCTSSKTLVCFGCKFVEHQATGQVQICSKSNVTTANKAAMVATLEIDYRLLPNRLLA